MSAADLAIVLVTLASIAALVVLIVSVLSLVRTSRALRLGALRLDAELQPLIGELRETVVQAGAEVDRVDDLLDTAAAIQQTVDHASRLTYVAFANPLIKFVAFLRGVGRGTDRAWGPTGRRRRRVTVRREQRALRRQARLDASAAAVSVRASVEPSSLAEPSRRPARAEPPEPASVPERALAPERTVA